MTRTMFDSTTAADIPAARAQLVAGYISGSYRWSAADWARFPGIPHVTIATQASVNDGVVLDVENGDATPAQAPAWVQNRRRAGVDPTVYVSQSRWQEVQTAFNLAGVPHPHYWIAAYPGGGPVLPTLNGITAIAHQYADPADGSGGHWDTSVVAAFWPGVDNNQGVDDLAWTDPVIDPATGQPAKDINGNTYSYGTAVFYSNKFVSQLLDLVNAHPTLVPDSTAKLTLVDYVRNVDARTYRDNDILDGLAAELADPTSGLAAIAAKVGQPVTATLSSDQLTALEQAVASAVAAKPSATPAEIAAATVTLLSQKLGA